jgi:hypothetical protein
MSTVPASQETHYFSIMKTNQLMLFKKIVIILYKNEIYMQEAESFWC